MLCLQVKLLESKAFAYLRILECIVVFEEDLFFFFFNLFYFILICLSQMCKTDPDQLL